MQIKLLKTETIEGDNYSWQGVIYFFDVDGRDVKVSHSKRYVRVVGELRAQITAFKDAADFLDPELKEKS